jgi:hypothetical protein
MSDLMAFVLYCLMAAKLLSQMVFVMFVNHFMTNFPRNAMFNVDLVKLQIPRRIHVMRAAHTLQTANSAHGMEVPILVMFVTLAITQMV